MPLPYLNVLHYTQSIVVSVCVCLCVCMHVYVSIISWMIGSESNKKYRYYTFNYNIYMNYYTNYIVIVIYLLCSYFNSTPMSGGDVFMSARQQLEALHTRFLVSGIMFDIIYVRLCCNQLVTV